LAMALLPILGPVLLAEASNTPFTVASAVGAVVFFILGIGLLVLLSAVLSFVMQVVRRVCVLEGLGVFASIRRGLSMVGANLKQVGIVWLAWIGIRLAWMFLGVVVVILISPVLLVSFLGGAVLGGLPAALVGALGSLFVEGWVPWAMGAVVGLPIFLVVLISPTLLVNGLVEIFKSNTWTLAYRELRTKESLATQPSPKLGAADLQPATAAQ
jgi:hypothetical protein